MVHFQRFKPSPELVEYIQGYWHIKNGDKSECLDLVPDGHPEVYFILKGGLSFQSTNGEMKSCPPFGMVGQLKGRFLSWVEPNTEVLYAKLYPWTPFPFFKIPFWELNDQMAEIDTAIPLGNEGIHQLGRSVLSAENIQDSIGLLDSYFKEKLKRVNAENPFINYAIQKIYQTNGTISIDGLTQKIHASRRYVEKVFKKHIGMSPKQYARLIRVKKASLLLLEEGFKGNISQVAASLDYYDQSHFLKDFKIVVNRTPSEFLRQNGNIFFDEIDAYLRQWDYS